MKKYFFLLVISFLGFCQLTGQTFDVEWTDLVGVAVEGNSITMTATTGWQKGAAASKNLLAAGADGWVETVVEETNTHRFFGLSEFNENNHYTKINYAFFFLSNGSLRIYESGAYKGAYGAYESDDKFKIERVNGVVVYKKNDAVEVLVS